MNELVKKLLNNDITSLFTGKEVRKICGDMENKKELFEEALMKSDIEHIKGDIYTLGRMARKELITDEVLAQLLVPNSYVSMEFVLSKISWIPEAVYMVTSVTNGENKFIRTKYGNYGYENIKQRVYGAGVKKVIEGKDSFLEATPLKALADIICRRGYEWRTVRPLEESFRIEYDDLETLQGKDFDELQGSYGVKNVENFLSGVRKELAV